MRVFRFSVAAAIATLGANAGASCGDGPGDAIFVYVGSYTRNELWTNGTGDGVHVLQLNTTDGSLTPASVVSVGTNPTFITGTSDKRRPVVYVVNESNEPSETTPGQTVGRVFALVADPVTGALSELNSVETGGNYSMHASLSPAGDFLAVANYFGGSVSLFPLDTDGSLRPASAVIQFSGGSHVNALRQEGPHLHSTVWVGPDSPGVFAADLGNDRVVQFRFDPKAGKLAVDPTRDFVSRPPGSGPRHLAVHPSKRFVYATEELSNTIAVYALDAAAGRLAAKATQTVSTLPDDFAGASATADIHISRDGRFLYASNRGHDSIAVFKINGDDGMLEATGFEPTRGRAPRAFAVYDSFLVVANQASDTVQVFRADEATGRLRYTGHSSSIRSPVGVFIADYN